MKEKDLLIFLAVQKFNEQYGVRLDPKNCTIRRIITRKYFDLSFEIITKRLDDNVRLHLHINFASRGDSVNPYRLETNTTQGVGSLTDETYVTTAVIDSYHKLEDNMKFENIEGSEPVLGNFLLTEDGDVITSEVGEYLEVD